MRALILVFFVNTAIGGCYNKSSMQQFCDVERRRGLCLLFNDQFKQFVTGNPTWLNRKCCSDSDALEKAYIITKNGDKIVKTPNGKFKPMEFDTCAIKGETFCTKCCKVDVCDPNPCENGGTCSPIGNSFNCNCPTGYLGKFCDLSRCVTNNPCVNNGTCYISEGNLSCSCPSKLLGIYCEKMDCNFDDSYCAWKQSSDDVFDWIRNSGKTPTSYTGPRSDHTGGGSYIYFEASAGKEFDTSRLESPEFNQSTSTKCLSFWYNMYGKHMGRLNVYIKTNQTELGNAVWTKAGKHNRVWYHGYVNVSKIPVSYSIVFEAVRGYKFRSDIAIDDITFVEGDCPGV